LVTLGNHVWVIFGFCGHELSDIHRFDLEEQTWAEVRCSGDTPTGRSVFGTATVGEKILLYGGEVDPSDQGHMGAGAFSSELLVLDTGSQTWSRATPTGADPGARGWYAAASFGNNMLVYGGNSDSNDRLDDIFILTVEE
jgi:N-acetylneuraminic acid mutarotase